MSHNSLGTSYCRIPAKRTGISRKTSAFIAGRNGADREVPACFARGGTGRYGTLKVNRLSFSFFFSFLFGSGEGVGGGGEGGGRNDGIHKLSLNTASFNYCLALWFVYI